MNLWLYPPVEHPERELRRTGRDRSGACLGSRLSRNHPAQICRIGVRSEPTPPPRPRLDVAPPAPGRLPADGPARFGQQPAVPPLFDQVSLDAESFADLGKPNRLMLRVLVRHRAPGACSRSERRCLGRRRLRPLDTRSVGRESVLGYPAAERSPTRRPRATRDGPPEGRNRPAGRKREAVRWRGQVTPGTVRPPCAWLPEQPSGPDFRPEFTPLPTFLPCR